MKTKENYAHLGHIPIGIGAVLKGWNIPEENFQDPNRLPIVDFRAMTLKCPLNCFHCFTDKNKNTLSLSEIKRVIHEIAEIGAYGINFLGEGEPTIDKHFFEIIEYTSSLNVIPVVFTEAATKLTNRDFVKRLKNSGASISPKCDSLFNAQYQNWVVQNKNNTYFDLRNEALKILIEEGFNEINSDGSTRLGLDMVISSKNINEVSKTLKFCRENNIWIVFSLYIPSGRIVQKTFDQNLFPTKNQILKMQEEILAIDKTFGFEHLLWNNFGTIGCVERMQIYGDGRVSPCPGNENIIGTIQEFSIKELHQKLLQQFPLHNPKNCNGNCFYR